MDSRGWRVSAEASRNNSTNIRVPTGGNPGSFSIHCGRENIGTDLELSVDFRAPTSDARLYDTSTHNEILEQEECDDPLQGTGAAVNESLNYSQFSPSANSSFCRPHPDDLTYNSLDEILPNLQPAFRPLSRGMVKGPGRRGRHSDVTPRQVYFFVMWLAHR
jgi:hypothetical protein